MMPKAENLFRKLKVWRQSRPDDGANLSSADPVHTSASAKQPSSTPPPGDPSAVPSPPDVPQCNTSTKNKHLQSNPVPQVAEATTDESNQEATAAFPAISELWDEAYDQLHQDDAFSKRIATYEEILSKSLGKNKIATDRGQRRQEMENIVNLKTKEVEDDKWKARFKGYELRVKDLIKPVLSVIEWSKEFVGQAVQPSPPASIAWAGVCLLLPVCQVLRLVPLGLH